MLGLLSSNLKAQCNLETSYFIEKVTVIKHGRNFLKLRFNNKQTKDLFTDVSIYIYFNNPKLFNFIG